ncbi:unnamed protein product, partial [Hapterophycus canaliculatus]
SRCVRTESECKYIKRRWHHGDPLQHRQQDHPRQSDHDAMLVGEDAVHPTSGALVKHRMLPFKRCRLRASPATGLVGMQENAFLSDFFGCVGFLPLTDESQIRETVVKIMAPDVPRRKADFGNDYHVDGGQLSARDVGSTFGNLFGTKQLPKDPSFCTFWCAVAVGALSKGSPIESVKKYSELAKEALVASRYDSTDAELAKASASLTYLHSFMGDRVRSFQESLGLSESFLQASREQGSAYQHVGLPHLIQHCKKVGNVQNGSMDSSWVDEEDPRQLEEVVTEGDLYRFVAQSLRAIDRAIRTKARERRAGDLEHFSSGGPSNNSSHVNDALSWEISEAIAAVLGTGSSLEFEQLQETADRPNIRAGIGGLLISGTLVFGKAAKGDLRATLERLSRSVEVYERYPGLCRCMMG